MYITAIKDMYNGAKIQVRTGQGRLGHIHMVMGLQHGSALIPFLFVVAMDVSTRHIQGEVPWCIFFF